MSPPPWTIPLWDHTLPGLYPTRNIPPRGHRPPPRNHKKRMVRILLECVLVYVIVVNLSETAEVDNAVFGKMTSKDLIVMLSTSANIVSRHTSFVGVDKVIPLVVLQQYVLTDPTFSLVVGGDIPNLTMFL